MATPAQRVRRGICCGLLLLVTVGLPHAAQAVASVPLVSSFSVAGAGHYQSWCTGPHCPVAARTAILPSGTHYVNFAFTLAGVPLPTSLPPTFVVIDILSSNAVKIAEFAVGDQDPTGQSAIAIHGHTGTARVRTLAAETYPKTSLPFPDDAYTAEISVQGQLADSTRLTVGAVRSIPPRVPVFYPVTSATANAWQHAASTALPRSAAFPVGATDLYFYGSYAGFTLTDAVTLLISSAATHASVLQDGPVRPQRIAGSAVFVEREPDATAFPSGKYQAELLVGDYVAASTTFQIGVHGASNGSKTSSTQTGLRVSALYATWANNYATWTYASDPRAAPHQVNSFPSGLTSVAFYFVTNFAWTNVGDMNSSLDRFTLVIQDGAGTTIVHENLTAISLPSGASAYKNTGMIRLWAPQRFTDNNASAFRDDTYRVTLLVDSRPAAHSTFTVGNPSQQHALMPVIGAFFPIASATYTGWTHGNFSTPVRVITYPLGTQMAFFYVAWKHADLTVPVTLVIRNAQQLPEVQRSFAPFGKVDGTVVFGQGVPNEVSYRSGTYTATIAFGPDSSATTTFIVGGQG